ncbi:GyrI-like domain-containing protein [Enterovirga aerilata]|uniref:GyrI-like domain-containing protein n=1 Tax=Enterovirga aerilata TaxID=2730920 RepID=A0A849I057_9HYPH|nr:GyrI-like domain-containing protein [Enterovirga sp. DB1703]NNM73146.1 GyrI-like domain-containing protein [Enterovirga sp. DB1703]
MARRGRIRIGAALLALALAQGAAAQAPAPVESAPVTPPAATAPATPPAASPPPQAPPAATIQQPGPPPATLVQPAPPGAAPAAPAVAGRPTLIPGSGDTSSVDEVVLPEKPVLILSGTSGWEDGLKNLRAAFGRIEAELARLGIAPTGRPLAVFVQTSDDNFRYDAMVPIAAVPTPAPGVPAEMRFGTTPSGKAYRFVHKGPYDDIDTTYETITTYLDAKDILAKDAFIEEYVNDAADSADPALEINIFVQPR